MEVDSEPIGDSIQRAASTHSAVTMNSVPKSDDDNADQLAKIRKTDVASAVYPHLKHVTSTISPDRIITVSVGAQGSLLVWDPDDAIMLQRDRGMQGSSIGMYPRVPVQDAFMTLPIELMPEEAAYLRDKGLAVFVDERSLVKMPNLNDAAAFHEARQLQVSQQIELYERLRVAHLDLHKDTLFNKLLEELNSVASKEGISLPEDETENWALIRQRYLEQPDEDNQIINVELPTRSWRVKLDILKMDEIKFEYPVSQKEQGLYAAYCALKESGFSLTSGANYGADFLAFKGDPHLVYSSYMVNVVEVSGGPSLDDYLRLGRVATTAKKALLWVVVDVRDKEPQTHFCCGKWALMK